MELDANQQLMLHWIPIVLGVLLMSPMGKSMSQTLSNMFPGMEHQRGRTIGGMILVFLGPTMFAQFVNLQGIEVWWFILPVFNITLAMREALMGIYDPVHIIMWVSTSLIYAIGAIWWASKQFNREDLVESLS